MPSTQTELHFTIDQTSEIFAFLEGKESTGPTRVLLSCEKGRLKYLVLNRQSPDYGGYWKFSFDCLIFERPEFKNLQTRNVSPINDENIKEAQEGVRKYNLDLEIPEPIWDEPEKGFSALEDIMIALLKVWREPLILS